MFMIFCGLVLAASTAGASTFVGNGGSAGEVETLITLRQIHRTYANFEPPEDLCSCSAQFENHSLCEMLKNLTAPQHQMCVDGMRERAQQMQDLADPSRVRIEWTHDRIEVMEMGEPRAVDAVANPKDNKITINQERFLEMKAFERLFLLTHELLHFTKEGDALVSDEGPLGAFPGPVGGRQYLNAMASGTVMQATDDGLFDTDHSILQRAQAWHHAWIDASVGTFSPGDPSTSSPYAMEHLATSSLAVRYYPWDQWGFVVGYASAQNSKTVLTEIQAREETQTLSFGVSYRIFPFANPLTATGQSHFVLNAMIEKLHGRYTVDENDVHGEWETDAWGQSLSCTYFLPIWKFWLHAGATLHLDPYEYSDLGLRYDKPQITTHLGVSYGF